MTPSPPGVWTYVVCSGLLPVPLPPPLRAHTPTGCGHGGTRKSNTSRRVHTRSVSPAAIAGVRGCHVLAEPVPLVGPVRTNVSWAASYACAPHDGATNLRILLVILRVPTIV